MCNVYINVYVYLSVHGFLCMCLMIFSSLINLWYALLASSHLNYFKHFFGGACTKPPNKCGMQFHKKRTISCLPVTNLTYAYAVLLQPYYTI